MALKSEVDQAFAALVESGNIRYAGFPAAIGASPCAVAASAQLFTYALAPAVPYWLCGFRISVATGIVAETTWRISIGYGGVDGAGNVPAIYVVTNWYVGLVGAAANGMGGVETQMFPRPIRIPAGQRMAYTVVDQTVGGGEATTDCRVILATAVGD